MPILSTYKQFSGAHWETGSVRDFFAHQGIRAPHTGQPYSEAFFMGVSGGAVMGYFSFAYEGVPPMARILTRNTFDPWDRMLSRLGVEQYVQHTAKADRAFELLCETLAEGVPAIVWADMFSLPYNAAGAEEKMWAMMPILVFGVDEVAELAYIADRAQVPLQASLSTLAAARARVKKYKHRLITLAPPQEDKVAAAVQLGIWDCIRLYTEKPPKGSRNNFGLQGLQHWTRLLINPKARNSWAKIFPPGKKMLAGLMSAYTDINHFGKNCPAERDVYADFLDEAATLLEKPDLSAAAEQFRRSGAAWEKLSLALLPDEIPPFQQIRQNMDRQHTLFRARGGAAREEILALKAKLKGLEAAVADEFPLDDAGVATFYERLSGCISRIYHIEAAAVELLRNGMQS